MKEHFFMRHSPQCLGLTGCKFNHRLPLLENELVTTGDSSCSVVIHQDHTTVTTWSADSEDRRTRPLLHRMQYPALRRGSDASALKRRYKHQSRLYEWWMMILRDGGDDDIHYKCIYSLYF